MTGSFGKRAKALAIFAGLLPMTAAQAQDATPRCEFKLALSKTSNVTGSLFTQGNDPAVEALTQIVVEATKSKPKSAELLVSPTAAVRATYSYRADGLMLSRKLEVRNPYTVAAGVGPVIDATLTIEGLNEKFSMDTYSFENWEAMVYSNNAEKFGALKNDVTLSIGPPEEGGTSYVLTFPKADLGEAYKAAKPQMAALIQKAQGGLCKPANQPASAVGTGCFLTSATCEAVGLADDCWELRTLRRFRDGWLAQQQDGGRDIAAYYSKAPKIADRLRSDPQALLRLYWTRIVPSAVAAQLGANKTARAIYSKGMRELASG